MEQYNILSRMWCRNKLIGDEVKIDSQFKDRMDICWSVPLVLTQIIMVVYPAFTHMRTIWHSKNVIDYLAYTLSSKHGAFIQCFSMLGQRRRRWTNIETALDECPVFAG